METYKKSYELVPRIPRDRQLRPGEKKMEHGPYETAPVFGRWTLKMQSGLRRIYGVAEKNGDKELMDRVLRAYWWTYNRSIKTERARR